MVKFFMVNIGFIKIENLHEMPRTLNLSSECLQNGEMFERVESLYDQVNTEVEFTCKFGSFSANISIGTLGTTMKFKLMNCHLLSKN